MVTVDPSASAVARGSWWKMTALLQRGAFREPRTTFDKLAMSSPTAQLRQRLWQTL